MQNHLADRSKILLGARENETYFEVYLQQVYRKLPATDTIHIDSIIRSNRRTIALVMNGDGSLTVRAPLTTPEYVIRDLVLKKRDWITRKRAGLKNRPVPHARQFINGEEFFFLGRAFRLQIVEPGKDPAPAIRLGDRLYVPDRFLPDIRARLKKWYATEAETVLKARCTEWELLTGLKPSSIQITGAERRWGSCSPGGRLHFSWRLVMAPPEVIDYVIVHELTHISQPDHSHEFWRKVREIMPDYKKHRDWLKEHGRFLTL
jgi:predicted metal-dependent hydrolase